LYFAKIKLKKMNIIFQTWPWYISGFFNRHDNSLTYFGKAFGMSSNLRSLCSMAGLETRSLFDFDWKAQRWNLVVVVCDARRFYSCSFHGDPQMLL
jgi:hypothetical protein